MSTTPAPLRIGQRLLALDQPSYFIADIAANHDGDLERAKALIWLAKEAGADCAKFQHFKAEKIVSARGFQALGGQQSHQAAWKKPVVDVYRHDELNRAWNAELAATAAAARIDFMTTPYDDEAVDTLNAVVPAWKIGSGDISYLSLVERVARPGKPIMVASGASTQADVDRAVKAASRSVSPWTRPGGAVTKPRRNWKSCANGCCVSSAIALRWCMCAAVAISPCMNWEPRRIVDWES